MLKWNDSQKRYEDQLFPGEKHDHKKYMAALAQKEEASAESKTVPGTLDTKNTVPETEHIQGTECKGCAANGFPSQIIFFREDVKSKTQKKIPLEYAEKVQGQYIGHEHRTKDNPNPVCKPLGSVTTVTSVTPPSEEQQNVQPVTEDSMIDLIKAWTFEMRQFNAWAASTKSQIETCVGYILNEKTVKPADKA